MTTYTVLDTNGDLIATGLTAADAAAEMLTDDGREFDIRAAADGTGFDLWTRQQVANKGWTITAIYSVDTDRAAAEARIFAKVIAADWPHHPTVLTDQQYAEMLAELED
jgi:multidrug efflux pump subunit AcrA (membrane-fusion protein)